MLQVESLGVRYGSAVAVGSVSFHVPEGTVRAIVGANGAGKSSIGRAVAGINSASGSIRFGAQDITGMSAERRVAAGIVYVPEGRHVFTQLTVEENLRAGGFVVRRQHSWTTRRDWIYERIPRLRERAEVRAGLLSGGEQQLLAIGRALMAHPRLVILDEPSLGLSPTATETVATFLQELLADGGLTVLLLEQNVSFAGRIASGAYVLGLGDVRRELTADELADADLVRGALTAADDR